jgi:glycosyltransferase involved in cell wall biosynthesis
MGLLESTGLFDVRLLYVERTGTTHTWPLPGHLDPGQVTALRWAVGKRALTKALRKAVLIPELSKRIRQIKPDVVHACSPIETLIAARLSRTQRWRPRILYTLQDTCDWMHTRVGIALQRWAFEAAEQIFVTSDAFETEFLRKLRLVDDAKPVSYVPNVPPAEFFAGFNPKPATPQLTVAYIGTLRGLEGLRHLVDSARCARQKGADVRVLFAGGGADVDFVQAAARETDFVTYAGPYQYDRDIRKLYGQGDVVYSLYERTRDKAIHIPYRFCEAINCRLPILVAKDTHVGRLVEQYGVGASVALGDNEELAGTLVDWCTHPEKRTTMSNACRNLRGQYVFEHYRERVVEAYS